MQKMFFYHVLIVSLFIGNVTAMQPVNAADDSCPPFLHPLFQATVTGDADRVTRLLETEGMDPNKGSNDVEPFFHMAATLPYQEKALQLIKIFISWSERKCFG